METISSEADSHHTSHFASDAHNNYLRQQQQQQRPATTLRQIDPEYMERARALVSNSTEFKVGEKPLASSAQKNSARFDDDHAAERLLVLQSRPQKYESLSLTNSTDFGQHSVGSSIEVANLQGTGMLTSAKPAAAAVQKVDQIAARERDLTRTSGQPPVNQQSNAMPRQFHPQHSTILEDLREEDISFALSSKASRPFKMSSAEQISLQQQ